MTPSTYRERVERMAGDVAQRCLAADLDWQIRVNTVLLAAGYHSAEEGLIARADRALMEDAMDAGTTPEEFAAGILEHCLVCDRCESFNRVTDNYGTMLCPTCLKAKEDDGPRR